MSLMYVMMLCIIYYNTCIFNSVLYTFMCMISSINNNNILLLLNTRSIAIILEKICIQFIIVSYFV